LLGYQEMDSVFISKVEYQLKDKGGFPIQEIDFAILNSEFTIGKNLRASTKQKI